MLQTSTEIIIKYIIYPMISRDFYFFLSDLKICFLVLMSVEKDDDACDVQIFLLAVQI